MVVKDKVYAEIARAAVLATHSAGSMMASSRHRDACRLLRAAEALTRSAVAMILAAPSQTVNVGSFDGCAATEQLDGDADMAEAEQVTHVLPAQACKRRPPPCTSSSSRLNDSQTTGNSQDATQPRPEYRALPLPRPLHRRWQGRGSLPSPRAVEMSGALPAYAPSSRILR